jgi:hypothetical protein
MHLPRSVHRAHGGRPVRWVAELGGLAALAAVSTLVLAATSTFALADGGASVQATGSSAGSAPAGSAVGIGPVQDSAARAAAPSGATPARARTLDLSLPPLRLVLTPQQLTELTAPSDDDGPLQDVTVSTPAYVAPVPTGQVRALTWALMHPLDAWRIFAPITTGD